MAVTTLQKLWLRPALMILSVDKPTPSNVTTGQWDLGSSYIYLTDDNRSELQVSLDRIEYKKRMINGRMRSYHVADKKTFSVRWKDLPSNKNEISELRYSAGFTNWASGQEMLEWHKNRTDSFYLSLVYDTPFADPTAPIEYSLEYYNVFFEDFGYVVTKRGQKYDLWDVAMTLVEV